MLGRKKLMEENEQLRAEIDTLRAQCRKADGIIQKLQQEKSELEKEVSELRKCRFAGTGNFIKEVKQVNEMMKKYQELTGRAISPEIFF